MPKPKTTSQRPHLTADEILRLSCAVAQLSYAIYTFAALSAPAEANEATVAVRNILRCLREGT